MAKKNYKLVIFDLDNTLYYCGKSWEKATNACHRVLKQHIKLTKEEYLKAYGEATKENINVLSGSHGMVNRTLIFKRMLWNLGLGFQPSLIEKLTQTYWKAWISGMELFPGVEDLLQKIKKSGKKIAVVTDLTADIQYRKILKLGLDKYIDMMITSDEFGVAKPNPLGFYTVLTKLDVRPKDAIMIGDEVKPDVDGANLAGIDSVLKPNDVSVYTDIERARAKYVINEFKELEKIIL